MAGGAQFNSDHVSEATSPRPPMRGRRLVPGGRAAGAYSNTPARSFALPPGMGAQTRRCCADLALTARAGRGRYPLILGAQASQARTLPPRWAAGSGEGAGSNPGAQSRNPTTDQSGCRRAVRLRDMGSQRIAALPVLARLSEACRQAGPSNAFGHQTVVVPQPLHAQAGLRCPGVRQ